VILEQKLEREDRDEHQDQHWTGGPDHLDHGVVRPAGRHRVGFAVEPHRAVDQQAKHEQRDDRDDRHQDHIVEEDRVVLQLRRGGLQINRVGRRLTQKVLGLGLNREHRHHREGGGGACKS
jgi:hypothetical protein